MTAGAAPPQRDPARPGGACSVRQTLGQTASFRQTAPETWCQSRVCGARTGPSPRYNCHVMKKVRWGVLGAANIAIKRVIPSMQAGERCEIVGIASRDGGRAQAAARELGIPKAYGSYEEMLADPKIDAVYNPLPNHLHVPWTIKAAEAGKHVLCEKPLSLSAAEAETLLAVQIGRASCRERV